MKCTVVSLVPFPINEYKAGLYPGRYCIPACKENSIEVLVIDESSHFVYMGEDRGNMRVRVMPDQIAESIVTDYRDSQLGFDRETGAGPGIFWKEGVFTKEQVEKQFVAEILHERKRQVEWFTRLVRLADDDWNRYHNHKVISDTQRSAAKFLGLHDKEWMIEPSQAVIENVKTIKCFACKTVVDVETIICPTCKVVLNKEKAKDLVFAK